MTNLSATAHSPTEASDAELVRTSLLGNREAFGKIVERYQNLICSLAFSKTGDVARSEDLAQEVFVTAWKQLRTLKDPALLKAWICGIARNLIHSSLRHERSDPIAHSGPLDEVRQSSSPSPLPADQAISAEEQSVLWKCLDQMPDLYREPLVLFYREHQSIECVAQALELSEDAVKQRLSRGRRMLEEQVLTFVEGALKRTVPGRAFTIGVLAALPAVGISSTAAAATIGSAAAKGSGVVKAASAMTLLAVLAGPVLGILGGWLGARASIENTETPRERRFMERVSMKVVALVAVFCLSFGILMLNARNWASTAPALFASAMGGLILAYVAFLFEFTRRNNKRQMQIRAEERAKLPLDTVRRLPDLNQKPYEYRSRLVFLGLPLVHIRSGNLGAGRGPALGWIAIGDTAIGVLLAMGGAAFGGIAIGGMGVGVIGLGGFGLGVLAIGGWAMGYMAAGGGAMAWHAAFGGLAIAHDFALGGLAVAKHGNDAMARSLIETDWFLSGAKELMRHAQWIWVLSVIPVFYAIQAKRKAKK